nr:myomegalin isoform X1 [Oryctolagus cuniculus]XP_008262740.1 myomegalin isoform X1 [Oryctolagus cuniculus]XP_051714691.1 myomegalin isoform X1 [Oryctolagus cuniculus]
MSQVKAGMHQPSGKKGPAEKRAGEQTARPEEAGCSSMSHSGKFHTLAQNQMQELSHLQQKVRIGRVVSSLLLQHVKNTVKTFEELLSSKSIDRSTELYFQEQLSKGRRMAESIAEKFSTDDCTNTKTQTRQASLTLSILREIQRKHEVLEVLETQQDARSQNQPQIHTSSPTPPPDEQRARSSVTGANVSLAIPADSAVLLSNNSGGRSAQPSYLQSSTTQPSGTPGPGHHGCSSPGEEMRPQKMNASGDLSSFSSLYRPNSKPSGSDLLEKNLIEIHTLRQRLEESVCINDRLRERLGHVLSSTEQGKSTAQPALTVSRAPPRSCTQSHSSGSGQDSL